MARRPRGLRSARACAPSSTSRTRPVSPSSTCSSSSARRCVTRAPTWTRPRTQRDDLPFFEDGAEPAQFEGYTAIGTEIVDQLGERPALTVVPVGNGALLIGVARGVEGGALGVVSKEAPVMALSVEAGRPVDCDRSSTFADGLAVRVAIPLAVEVLGEFASRMLEVSEREIAYAVGAYADAEIRAEGAAGAALAALPQLDDLGDPLVLVVTGRNIDDELFTRVREQPDSFPA
jgi:threonine dehydratase